MLKQTAVSLGGPCGGAEFRACQKSGSEESDQSGGLDASESNDNPSCRSALDPFGANVRSSGQLPGNTLNLET